MDDEDFAELKELKATKREKAAKTRAAGEREENAGNAEAGGHEGGKGVTTRREGGERGRD